MILYPNAKINVGLEVLKKRKDGFHNIRTVFYPVALCDILEIIPKDKDGKPIEHLSSAVIDSNPNLEGIQELKEWKMPFEFINSFQDTNNDAIPDFPSKYNKKLGRIMAEPSWNPYHLVRNGTWVTWTVVGVLAFCLCMVAALVTYIRKKLK